MHSYHALTHVCVSVVVCVARMPRPCLSFSRRREVFPDEWGSACGGDLLLWSAVLGSPPGGGGSHNTPTPHPRLSDWVKVFSGPSANQKALLCS